MPTGQGQYAQVFKGKKKSDGENAADVAIKIIDRKDTGANVQSVTDKEIEVMLKIDHPGCVKLHEVYQTADQVVPVVGEPESTCLCFRFSSLWS